MQIYAGSFFAIPLFRWFFMQRKNAEIEKRNQAREQSARALEVPDLTLRRKVINIYSGVHSLTMHEFSFHLQYILLSSLIVVIKMVSVIFLELASCSLEM